MNDLLGAVRNLRRVQKQWLALCRSNSYNRFHLIPQLKQAEQAVDALIDEPSQRMEGGWVISETDWQDVEGSRERQKTLTSGDKSPATVFRLRVNAAKVRYRLEFEGNTILCGSMAQVYREYAKLLSDSYAAFYENDGV